MPTSVLLPEGIDDVVPFATRAEDAGYDRLWATELWGRDAFVALARAAEACDDLDLGTAIVNIYGRSPATIAQAAATVSNAGENDLRLGLGTSTKKAIEDLHAREFAQPARRLHETVELVKEYLIGDDRVYYEGELYEVADFPALDADVPVYTAALGPANRRATGRTADGWLPHNIPFETLDEAFETIAETASAAGRDPDDIAVAPYVPAAVSEETADAVDAIKGHLAYYVGSGEGYRRAVAELFPDEADAVAEAWRDGDRGGAREAVTREMVEALGVAGTPEEARAQLADIGAIDIIDEPIVVAPAGADQALIERTVDELGPEN